MEKVTGVNAGMLSRIQAMAVALLSAGLAAAALAADDFPTRPVTIIVASTAGGGTDIVSRIVGEQLSKQLGQPFVVDNRPGAGSAIAFFTSALSLAMTSCGVFFGAHKPNQV